MNKRILIKPYVTEKSTSMSDKLNKYTFVVDRHANKLEIKQAIQDMYSVTVDAVHTIVVPAKRKTLFRNGKMTNGRKAGFKKAVVSLPLGETINIYGTEGGDLQ
jgi:large subunit ribosomal protein L23